MSRSDEFEQGHGLTLENRISVAEEAIERGHMQGRSWHVPAMHYDDPARAAAHRPVHDFVHSVLRSAGHPEPESIRVQPKDWELRHGGAQAYTDGMNKIGLAGEHTNDMTLLHESAHILHQSTEGRGGHTPEFAETLHGLYHRHLGPQASKTFRSIVGLRS